MDKRRLVDLSFVWVIGCILIFSTLEEFHFSKTGTEKIDERVRFTGGDFTVKYTTVDWVLPTMPCAVLGWMLMGFSTMAIYGKKYRV